jgi:hypothetical protein
MAGAKDPQPTQVVHVLELATNRTTHSVVLNSRAGKCRGSRVLDTVGYIETAKPVADPVGIAGPDDDLDARLNNCGESCKKRSRILFAN